MARYNERFFESIYHYSDYRSFLWSFAEYKRSSTPNWTLSRWAKQLRLGSPGVLANVLDGRRNPGPKVVQAFERYFQFSSAESEYFKELVNIQTKSQSDSSNKKQGKKRVIAPVEFKRVSSWLHHAIFVLSKHRRFSLDSKWIRDRLRFHVSLREIRSCLENLKLLNLINSSDKIVSSSGTPNQSMGEFHTQMIEHAKDSIVSVERELRDISSMTLLMNPSKVSEARDLIRRFRTEFSLLFEQGQSGEVYQLNVQLFPLSEKLEEGEENHEDQSSH